MPEGLLAAQLAVSSALAGLAWVVQLAVYPLFGDVLREAGAEGFRRYHAAYTRGMGLVAGPLMLAEAGLAAAWCAREPGGAAAWWGAAGVALAWAATFGGAVPAHRRLQEAPRETWVRRLVAWNAVRTFVWTLRAAGLWWIAGNG